VRNGRWSNPTADNGQDLLTDHAAGGVGLAASPLGGLTCDSLKIGYSDGDNYGALDDTIIDEDFTSEALPLVIEDEQNQQKGYDENGNLIDDGIYTYKYDAWNRLVEVQRKAVSVSDAKYARVNQEGRQQQRRSGRHAVVLLRS